ncbi:hypothetical protein [Brachybacterium subflavum]|uniref:hypothetical protein n=1 Tax=Brachybacterium subflavum TaxID=2585206 RepID=UPI001D0D4C28|nr:hypothetical protein [Brachybacterium subflavum]
MSLALLICSIVTAISALVSFVYAVVGLREADDLSRIPSQYALSRSLALLVVALIAVATGSEGIVAAVAVAMILVQTADAVIGGRLHDRWKTAGPAATALVNFAALMWMLLS